MKQILLPLFIAFLLPASLFAQPTRSTEGKVSFYFDNGGKMKSPIKVYYYSPKADADDMPIVVMMHGAERDASSYLNALMGTAEKLGCKIIAPEFDKEDFEGAELYNLGNVYDRRRRKFNPSDKWTYSLIEPLFDYVVSQTKSNCKGYYLYGHSAGSQFVHRFLMFVENPRVIRTAFANAGWYTMPDLNASFPYGLKGSPVNEAQLKHFLGYNACILVGDKDTDRSSIAFNVTAEAEAQGKTRFERGIYFYEYCKALAAKLNTPFNWVLVKVPDVGHDNGKMGESGLPCLLHGKTSN